MSCAFSKETLALHVEGDLSESAAESTWNHLATCDDCRTFLEALRARQSLLKSLRRETVSTSECTGMRRQVMAIVNDRRHRSGWALRVERTIVLGFQRRSFAMAAFAFIAIVSASVLAQMRHNTPDTSRSTAVFEASDTLLRPDRYRDWIVVGPSPELQRSAVGATHASPLRPDGQRRPAAQSVYMNPSAYREYAKTGRFPEGTVLIWESAGSPDTSDRHHEQSSSLLASVKDSSRFEEGWGFFNFTGRDGTLTPKAQTLPESSGCRACHRRDAETDHVFTQFYPVL